ncbi:hypothetical protein E1B28_003645 [Marasmius oreades]|uniref:Uncharacterized protein n=1 Tax=Marasmius oreades TaxID=181124 RepID=A0A9P8ABP3_9AGAR|nr:uncharacterized protein E1B28_003645 [Marasmius oreades]KAG7096195.1 hypothetical protein E1B28_003645 [Marasmius oreades]
MILARHPDEAQVAALLEDYRVSLVIRPVMEILIPGFLYGVYAVLYGICLNLLRKRKTPNHVLYIIMMTALFLSATAGLALNITSVIISGFQNLKDGVLNSTSHPFPPTTCVEHELIRAQIRN